MKKIVGAIIGVIICSYCYSQEQPAYSQAIGLKFLSGVSITYKKFVTEKNAIEAQANFWNRGYRLVGLYEFHFYDFDVDGLSWYVGPGAHIGSWSNSYAKDSGSKADIGIDGVIGMDYKFKNLPINLSADWQPSLSLIGSNGFSPSYGGIAIRYTF